MNIREIFFELFGFFIETRNEGAKLSHSLSIQCTTTKELKIYVYQKWIKPYGFSLLLFFLHAIIAIFPLLWLTGYVVVLELYCSVTWREVDYTFLEWWLTVVTGQLRKINSLHLEIIVVIC